MRSAVQSCQRAFFFANPVTIPSAHGVHRYRRRRRNQRTDFRLKTPPVGADPRAACLVAPFGFRVFRPLVFLTRPLPTDRENADASEKGKTQETYRRRTGDVQETSRTNVQSIENDRTCEKRIHSLHACEPNARRRNEILTRSTKNHRVSRRDHHLYRLSMARLGSRPPLISVCASVSAESTENPKNT